MDIGHSSDKFKGRKLGIPLAISLICCPQLVTAGGVTFEDIAANGGAGIDYKRMESPSDAILDTFKKGVLTLDKVALMPANSRGAPGVAVLDFDGDGDSDVYVTNGPGASNSLYANQLSDTGRVTFVDVAASVGAALTGDDSTGVCYGDIDNDDDQDMLVLNVSGANRLLENRGGTFRELAAGPALASENLHPSSCSMGDVNGDGLLDIAIANTFINWNNRLPLMMLDQEAAMERNQLFLNRGDHQFTDVSATAGIDTPPRISWAVALVDYDMDGDADMIVADDQGPRSPAKYGGGDFGYLRVYNNDGSGHFTDLTNALGLNQFGGWMGLAFGDINADGHMDMFASNIGDYASVFTGPMLGFGQVVGEWASVWWIGDDHGGFTKGTIDQLGATPFGWGNAMTDYDNDGDTDIIFYGGLDVGIYQDGSNAGAILDNDGHGIFSLDSAALAGSVDHARKNERGLAVGDLDGNGFVDIVSVSNQNWPDVFPTRPYPVVPLGSVFDPTSVVWPTFAPIDPTDFGKGLVWTGMEPTDGTLSVELNSGNDNRWIKVKAIGSTGLLDDARVNRDGIGAVVSFQPSKGRRVMRPILGGASYASQDSLESVFGLGSADDGMIEVFWPGGVKNRLYGVHAFEHITFPEIPCGFDSPALSYKRYHHCVDSAIEELVEAGKLSKREAKRFSVSAMRAYSDARRSEYPHSEIPGERHERMKSATGADSQVHFTDVVSLPDSGINYARAPSSNKAVLDRVKAQGFVDFSDLAVRSLLPVKPRGAPGVALFDFDGDGDLDIYATNGPGFPNSLLQNQFAETGELRLIEKAAQAGVALVDDDSTGVCVGDVDNDGDDDLVVLNISGQNRLFENLGDGKFVDISVPANLGNDGRHPSSCTMGDVNNDGLLDLIIGNTFDNWDHRLPLMTFNNDFRMEANQLLINLGDNRFQDRSIESGIGELARITWALALVDYDQDGDVDLVTADDQGAKSPAKYGGVDHGYVRVFRNDGSGHFENVTSMIGTDRFGAWMGLSFGDFNRDGLLDIFATNTGYFITNFMQPVLDFPIVLGEWASGWFLAQPNGSFGFPGVGNLVGTPFGWGTSTADYDNDTDTDIIYHGGMDMGAFVDASNPGAMLRNDGHAHFAQDGKALASSVNHTRRTVQGMAVGDLNNDGFTDIVTVASETWPDVLPLAPYLPPPLLEGTPFDATASIWPTFAPVDPRDFTKGMVATGMEPANGNLVVEVNAGNDNNWVKVKVMGSVGLLPNGRVNRDGIGATIRFRPDHSEPVLHPVVAGASYASEDSLTAIFGLAEQDEGVIEVLWPGGIRNRLYDARHGESIVFPEIPCSYDDAELSQKDYGRCVKRALGALVDQHEIEQRTSQRFFVSAMKAYKESMISDAAL